MKPLMRWALFLAVPLLFILAVSAAAGTKPRVKVKRTSWIHALAMDGPRVAYSTGPFVYCCEGGGVYVWNVRTGKETLVSRHNPDPVLEVAIAGTRVAWIARGGSGTRAIELNESLFAASLTRPGLRHRLATSGRTETTPAPDDPYTYAGDWIGGLVGSKSLLAVSRWSTAGPGTLTSAQLDVIASGGLKRRVSGSGSIVSQSTDGRRIAVLRSTDAWPYAGELRGKTALPSVGIYSGAGMLLREINTPAASEVALSGNTLAVLTKTSRLAVYNWQTGRLVHRWRVPSVGTTYLEDVYGQTAVYSAYSRYQKVRRLHVLQLTTGKDTVLTKGAGTIWNQGAQLEAPGLVYAVDKPGLREVGELVFVPMARVLAAVSKGHVR
jgi:hypothetical protein